ncbi:hypothetical protein HELRODRAFT_70377 [Helobdella robusta]|uniref:Thioredoxin domain-containing protein n=1 Tax=Helobdella robusta TaxID=6412 RepID=T1G057_HELRO|nr:hypothetical protein HELRODRAFT_70377 [Helobdella robusta]ESN91569.1 hypothetical protein HELRODRAFT_70377 [Helobdella robusta]
MVYPRAVVRNTPVSVTPGALATTARCPPPHLPAPAPVAVATVAAISSAPRRQLHQTNACLNEHIFNIQDSEDFKKRVLHSKVPTIVDFYATWCGPCKLLIPKLEQIVAKNEGKVVLAKIDIDVHTDIADSYRVSAVPTVIAMKNGKELDKFVGFKDDSTLETFVEKLLK